MNVCDGKISIKIKWGLSIVFQVILASDYEVLKILNYSFEEDATLNEVILSQTDSTLTSTIYNKRNGYKIGLYYTIVDENTLQCILTGDENSTVTMNRMQNKN